MSTGKGTKEILNAPEFAMIKEYIEVGGTDEGIASVTGLARSVVRKIREAPHYKQYMEDLQKVHRTKAKATEPDVVMSEDMKKVLINLTDAILKMTKAWEELEPKLDEAIMPKRLYGIRGDK